MTCDLLSTVSIADIANAIMAVAAIVTIIKEYCHNRRSVRQRTAHNISAWHTSDYCENGKMFYNAILSNASETPVYEVFVSIDPYGRSFEENTNKTDYAFISVLPQGKYVVSVPYAGHAAGLNLATSITFRDEYGQIWTRFSAGKLKRYRKYQKLSKKLALRRIKTTSYSVREINPPASKSAIKDWKQRN